MRIILILVLSLFLPPHPFLLSLSPLPLASPSSLAGSSPAASRSRTLQPRLIDHLNTSLPLSVCTYYVRTYVSVRTMYVHT